MSKIEVQNLYKVFGQNPQDILPQVKAGVSKDKVLSQTGHTVGLTNVSLNIEEGETFVVMGLSGSGKSTLIRCINRLIEPTDGEIRIGDTNILELGKHEVQTLRRSKMGMVFQRFALFPHRSVIENVAYGLNVQGMPREERRKRAKHWIKVVGLQGYENARPKQLSGGMQQRVGLARALCTDPEILLMDEAFSALDPLIRREMQDELLRLQKELHKTIVFITHDLDEALRLGDRVAILKDGLVVQIGTPEEILKHPADDYVEAFVQDVNRVRVLTAKSVMETAQAVRLRDNPREVLALMEKRQRQTVFVVDSNGHYQGTVNYQDAANAIKVGERNLTNVVKEHAPTTDAETVLEHLLALSADSPLPIAVLGERDLLLGIIPRSAILSALASQQDDEAVATSAVDSLSKQKDKSGSI